MKVQQNMPNDSSNPFDDAAKAAADATNYDQANNERGQLVRDQRKCSDTMTKGTLATLAKDIALDLSTRGITVNIVQPGPTASDMTPADGPRVDFLKGLIPLRRLGRDDEIANLVAYVGTPAASFITGAVLTADGGYAVWPFADAERARERGFRLSLLPVWTARFY